MFVCVCGGERDRERMKPLVLQGEQGQKSAAAGYRLAQGACECGGF